MPTKQKEHNKKHSLFAVHSDRNEMRERFLFKKHRNGRNSRVLWSPLFVERWEASKNAVMEPSFKDNGQNTHNDMNGSGSKSIAAVGVHE